MAQDKKLSFWESIWTRKAKSDSKDLREINGFEATSVEPQVVWKKIKTELSINNDDSVLEVGCGAGMLAVYVKNNYTGVDYVPEMISKLKRLTNKTGIRAEANKLPFEDNSFDVSFCFSVFQYFPSIAYALEVISEIERVSRKAVFIGDLPLKSHSQDHMIYTDDLFDGWKITNGYYNPDRFNASKIL